MTMTSDRNGKWTCSDHEEHWNCGEDFDTRDEALAYALGDYADGYDLIGKRVYVGQIVAVTARELAERAFDSDAILDSFSEHLYETVGEDFAEDVTMTKAQGEELEALLVDTLATWMVANGVEPTCFRIEHTSSHLVERELP